MTPPQSTRPATARVRLARIAEGVIDADDGVGATVGAGRWLTRDGDRTIAGVVVAESPGGAVDLQLHLIVATPVEPLEQGAERLRQAIREEAVRADLLERLGAIDVSFHDVAAPPEADGGPR